MARVFRTFLITILVAGAPAHAAYLWQIGKDDRSSAEFALAPDQWKQYASDGFFIVGRSDARQAWPYVHPGPDDSWAGSHNHTFTILFATSKTPSNGDGQLIVALVETHPSGPPRFTIRINGRVFSQTMPRGGSEASLKGHEDQSKPHRFAIPFPMVLLHDGINRIDIENASGSWVMYDWLALEAPGATLGAVSDHFMQIDSAEAVGALIENDGALLQPVQVGGIYAGPKIGAAITVDGGAAVESHELSAGRFSFRIAVPRVKEATTSNISIGDGAKSLASTSLQRGAVPELTIYVIPHSHVDIGYTHLQPEIEKKQVANLETALDLIQQTAGNPEGSRYRWMCEASWTIDHFLRTEPPQRVQMLMDAIRAGQVGLDGAYANLLTGLCRPEELMRVYSYSRRLADRFNLPLDSAMISDVPGYTWGTIPALAEAGIKYFSIGPNYIDRIGTTRLAWEDKPFYWLSPDGQHKVLCWETYDGYAFSHRMKRLSHKVLVDYIQHLQDIHYPYDITAVRWSGLGDNGVPAPEIIEAAKDWNAHYAWPKVRLATVSEAFSAFEKRYGEKLPVVRGDWTPYWEDGAASSALETAMTRASDERLVQAETLWVMLRPPGEFPADKFEQAWHYAILYNEHTWGAYCSISEPDSPFTADQWKFKRGYALEAHSRSQELLSAALPAASQSNAVDVINTNSWTRGGLVIVPHDLSSAGDCVHDSSGKVIASQRLSTGELAFIIAEVPPFSARRYSISVAPSEPIGQAKATANTLDNGLISVRLDDKTGNIVELRARGIASNLVLPASGGLNDYNYIEADDFANPRKAAPPRITIKESGPLVASLLVQSDAPGCRSLSREIRLYSGSSSVELIDVVDKLRAQVGSAGKDRSKSRDPHNGKEAVHIAFPFNIPAGRVRMDIPWAVVQPEVDQIPGACKNWFTVQRFVDISNDTTGVTFATVDAPMVELGAITATLLGSQPDPEAWIKHLQPSQTIYSYVMNNYWHTNYRAWQEGPTMFRYFMLPHGPYSSLNAQHFGIECSQPLIVAAASESPLTTSPRFTVSNPDVLVAACKPSNDGRATIIRLYGATDHASDATLEWTNPIPKGLFLTDTSEKPLRQIQSPVHVPPWGIITLRYE